ncbi:helix-turn-helix transcriptional regulator [Colwellia sp. MEBiC06753]
MMEPSFVAKSDEANRDNALFRPHPGSVFKRRCLSGEIVSTEEIARRIGLSVQEFDGFINCRLDLDDNLAERIALYSGIGADVWITYQRHYDLYIISSQSECD